MQFLFKFKFSLTVNKFKCNFFFLQILFCKYYNFKYTHTDLKNLIFLFIYGTNPLKLKKEKLRF